MDKNQYKVRIDSIAFEGKGVARLDGKVVFVRNAVPGDFLQIEMTKNKKSYSEGKIIEIIEPSPLRIEPLCNHFGVCGGCSFQNIPYDEQLKWKRQFVVDAFEKIAKLENLEIKEPIPSPKQFGYRNKMEFSFGTSRWITEEEVQKNIVLSTKDKHFALGFHLPERFDKIINIDKCLLQDNRGNFILNEVRKKALELQIPAYNLRSHSGFLRNLVFRFSTSNNEILVNLVTTSQIQENEKTFLDWYGTCIRQLDNVEHLAHTINDSYSPTSYGEVKILKGSGYLFEKILNVEFRISPFSFFQVNTLQASSLVKKVIELANSDNQIVWDLYSGAGTFSLTIASKSKFVYGIELLEKTVEDAIYNANLNKIDNVKFFAKDLNSKKILQELLQLEPPNVVIIDPPRTGIHKNLLFSLTKILPESIVYVSCNPTTQARDCFELLKFYNLVEIQPFDMFPQTYHIETIVLLVKK